MVMKLAFSSFLFFLTTPELPSFKIDIVAWIALALSLFTVFSSNLRKRVNYVVNFFNYNIVESVTQIYHGKQITHNFINSGLFINHEFEIFNLSDNPLIFCVNHFVMFGDKSVERLFQSVVSTQIDPGTFTVTKILNKNVFLGNYYKPIDGMFVLPPNSSVKVSQVLVLLSKDEHSNEEAYKILNNLRNATIFTEVTTFKSSPIKRKRKLQEYDYQKQTMELGDLIEEYIKNNDY